MKIAIVHYHLGHGGVSEVIAAASRRMTATGIPHIILAGPSTAPADPDLPVSIVEGLGYAEMADPDVLLHELRSAAGEPPDIWHFHNHSLGKNPAVPRVVARLAGEGERLLLQIHDLAEDGRPENAARLTERVHLYPVGPRVHYAFVNSRDRERFITAGLPESHAHPLPNPMETRPKSPTPSGAPLMLYPVRGIRRKNLGEFLLLAALAPPGTRAAITRAPLAADAMRIHDSWRRLSAEAGLPVEFDVVGNTGSSFEEWISKSTHLVTTSVSEGFGMVFPESAARGRPLLGRNLTHLTRDHGISTGGLYDRITVPMEWIDVPVLRRCRSEAANRLWAAWNRQPPANLPDIESVDFGNLPEILQQRVIRKLAEPGMKSLPKVEIGGATRPAVEWLAETLAHREPITAPHGIHQDHPCAIYQRMVMDAVAEPGFLDPEKILDAFLTPESFHFLTSPSAIRLAPPDFGAFRAVVFDVYGTLLNAPAGGVKPDPGVDPLLRGILARHGHSPPDSPSAALHAAVLRHHAAAGTPHPEVDLCALWRELLALPQDADTTTLVMEIEHAWHPARLMPGAAETLRRLAEEGLALGLLSNAQCNTISSLGECAALFPPDLTILSYQHGIAKPSPELFDLLAARLEEHGISPAETLYIGNDPLHDIEPAAARGFRTAYFTGNPESYRAGFCYPDYEITGWSGLKPP